MFARNASRRRAFSLIELIIVVVIIGILAAIAIPRMSRGSKGAAESALIADLAVLRNALDLFTTEHPGVIPPLADVTDALTQYSDVAGTAFSATKDATHYYGPYLRDVPPLPLGSNKGLATIVGGATPGTNAGGWWYDDATGDIRANLPDGEVDDASVKYNTY